MSRCNTCHFWKQFDEDDYIKEKDMAECTQPLIAEKGSDISEEEGNLKNMLLYQYNEGGSFKTGYNFGCVHHKGKK